MYFATRRNNPNMSNGNGVDFGGGGVAPQCLHGNGGGGRPLLSTEKCSFHFRLNWGLMNWEEELPWSLYQGIDVSGPLTVLGGIKCGTCSCYVKHVKMVFSQFGSFIRSEKWVNMWKISGKVDTFIENCRKKIKFCEKYQEKCLSHLLNILEPPLVYYETSRCYENKSCCTPSLFL